MGVREQTLDLFSSHDSLGRSLVSGAPLLLGDGERDQSVFVQLGVKSIFTSLSQTCVCVCVGGCAQA